MNNIDKYFAEQCGVEVKYSDYLGCDYYLTPAHDEPVNNKWTIADPRCREIVRERFGIQLVCHADLKTWIAFTRNQEQSGKTIAEAETACITAIYKQSIEDASEVRGE